MLLSENNRKLLNRTVDKWLTKFVEFLPGACLASVLDDVRRIGDPSECRSSHYLV